MYQLTQLLRAIALTVAHGFLGRCLNVDLALRMLGIKVRGEEEADAAFIHLLVVVAFQPPPSETFPSPLLLPQISRAVKSDLAALGDGLFIPDWVLDVKAIETSRVGQEDCPRTHPPSSHTSLTPYLPLFLSRCAPVLLRPECPPRA